MVTYIFSFPISRNSDLEIPETALHFLDFLLGAEKNLKVPISQNIALNKFPEERRKTFSLPIS